MNIYQHFRPEEREFIDQVLSWRRTVEDSFAPKLTDFLDPREQQIVKYVIGEDGDIKCDFFGGINHSERKRAIVAPNYFVMEKDAFQISIFEMDYPKKFITIEHPQVLGSLMSLGIKREKFGDILINGDQIQIVVAKEINSYTQLQFTQVGRTKISLSEIPFSQAIPMNITWLEEVETVSSLRLDSVISTIYNISRQKSQTLLAQGLVKVNFRAIEKPSFECREYDMISIRGYGRAKISSIEGKTKKDKWRITVGKQK
ncbi:RNA-binding protein [Bacillus sp. CGMCC 1.16607]|uniref:YlmH family RNA-binding protein n=1 Tax=Bacillus sp. CGMCC 1.16607 TaxID=3351842 RepID=UPI0036427B8F